jgi:hypothetical protein
LLLEDGASRPRIFVSNSIDDPTMADLQGRFCDFHVSTGVPVVEERGPGPQARLERALFTNFANVESNLSGGALRILIASGAQVEKIRAMGKPVLFGAIDDGYTVKPLYKHIIGNRIRMLIREVCLYKGN